MEEEVGEEGGGGRMRRWWWKRWRKRRWWWKRRWTTSCCVRVRVCVSGGTGSSTARHAAEHAPPAAALTSADPPPPPGHTCVLSPVSGTSVGLMMRLICSMDWRSGERPVDHRGERGGINSRPRECCGRGAELTSMAAEDLLVHDGGDGQAVEAVSEGLPQLDVEPAFTCKRSGRSEPRWPPKAWVA